jgi:cation diffusion facilitator family transporter
MLQKKGLQLNIFDLNPVDMENKKKVDVAILSVISNITLVILKLIIGIAINSVSVISEAIHSSVDLLASIIALFAVKESNKPPDSRHRYGHGKFENISGTVEAILIFVAAFWIIYESSLKLVHSEPVTKVGIGIIIMFFSSIINFLISNRLFKIGKKTDSLALQADGMHLRTDVWTSAGVAGGLFLYWAGKHIFPGINLNWIDPAAAFFVALLIINAAYKMTLNSASGLLDVSLPSEEEKEVIGIIESKIPGIYSYHNFKTRKAGADRFVEFHLIVDADMTVKKSHDICDDITREIKDKLPDTTVMIHIEPCDKKDCKQKCLENCKLQDLQNNKH